MVAGQNHHVVRVHAVDKINVLIDRVRRATIPLRAALPGVGRENVHAAVAPVQIPRTADAYIYANPTAGTG